MKLGSEEQVKSVIREDYITTLNNNNVRETIHVHPSFIFDSYIDLTKALKKYLGLDEKWKGIAMKLSRFLHDLTTTTAIFDLDYNCFSQGQLQSKEWVVEILWDVCQAKKLFLGTTYVLCGWYGILPALLFLKFDTIPLIRSFDIDPNCEKIADQINKTYSSDNWRFKAVTQDINEIDFIEHSWQCWSNKNNRMSFPITDKPDTIINTSCEHTDAKWFDRVPKGKFVVLQSNDSFVEEGHVNAITDLDEFRDMYPMYREYYAGSMTFDKYRRFMLIGVK